MSAIVGALTWLISIPLGLILLLALDVAHTVFIYRVTVAWGLLP